MTTLALHPSLASVLLKIFRITGYLEGISLLVLFGYAMPLKYAYGDPSAVKSVGWIHGLLFILYIACLTLEASAKQWPLRKSMAGILAAILPFGTFIFDRTLSREAK